MEAEPTLGGDSALGEAPPMREESAPGRVLRAGGMPALGHVLPVGEASTGREAWPTRGESTRGMVSPITVESAPEEASWAGVSALGDVLPGEMSLIPESATREVLVLDSALSIFWSSSSKCL